MLIMSLKEINICKTKFLIYLTKKQMKSKKYQKNEEKQERNKRKQSITNKEKAKKE